MLAVDIKGKITRSNRVSSTAGFSVGWAQLHNLRPATRNLLPVPEALELVHAAFHVLAGRVGCGADTLDAQLEVVGVGRAQERFLVGDEVARVEIEERLIERLHAVLTGASGDGVADKARLVRIDDAITDIRGRDHYFDGGDASILSGAVHEALADDGLERG